MVMAFRGVGKSWVTSAFVLWLLYCNPDTKILVVSASKTRADNFTTFCLQLINEVPILAHLAPTPDQRCSKVSFDVGQAKADQQPSVVSLGITSALAGNRADFIVPDDIEVLNNSATELMREKLSEAVKEFDAILKPGGQVVYLGTPQSEGSVYNRLPDRGYTIKVWPARYPSPNQIAYYGNRLAGDVAIELRLDPNLVGKTTEPLRFSDIDLAEREASYGKAGFALQFMLDTSLSDIDRFPLKLRDLPVWCLTPEGAPDRLVWEPLEANRIRLQLACDGLAGDVPYWASKSPEAILRPFAGICMSIDPGGRGADETAWAITACLNGKIFILDVGMVHGYDKQALVTIAAACKNWNVNNVLVEANFGDGMFTSLLRPVLQETLQRPIGLEEVKHSIQKERRICDTLEPLLAQHRLVLHSEVFGRDLELIQGYPAESAMYRSLLYQLTRITRIKGALKHDDRLDALAMGCAYWVEHMSRNVEQEANLARAKDRDELCRRFVASFTARRGLSEGYGMGVGSFV
jgi:hypothetical protein